MSRDHTTGLLSSAPPFSSWAEQPAWPPAEQQQGLAELMSLEKTGQWHGHIRSRSHFEALQEEHLHLLDYQADGVDLPTAQEGDGLREELFYAMINMEDMMDKPGIYQVRRAKDLKDFQGEMLAWELLVCYTRVTRQSSFETSVALLTYRTGSD